MWVRWPEQKGKEGHPGKGAKQKVIFLYAIFISTCACTNGKEVNEMPADKEEVKEPKVAAQAEECCEQEKSSCGCGCIITPLQKN
jgi:hypothetical protein